MMKNSMRYTDNNVTILLNMKQESPLRALKMLVMYKNKAKRRFKNWNAPDAKLEYILLKELDVKVKKLRAEIKVDKTWLSKTLQYMEKFITVLVQRSERWRLIFKTTKDENAGMKYLGVRAATSKCVSIYELLKTMH